MFGVQIALQPVIGRAVAELLDRFRILGFAAIQLSAFAHDFAQATRLRAVRVVNRFTLGVVLAVNGNPFLSHHARTQPQPETEEMGRYRPQIQSPVRLTAVQKNRDTRNREMGGDQGVQQQLPP